MGAWIIISSIIGVVILTIGVQQWNKGLRPTRGDIGEGIGIWALLSLFGVMPALLVIMITIGIADKTPIVVSTTDIVAIKDRKSVQGSFFLGCGQIDGVMKYHYMKRFISETGRTVYKAGAIKTSRANVVETNDESPKIVRYEYRIKNNFLRWLAHDPIHNREDSLLHPPTEIIVPVGSVIKNVYEVDLE